MIDISNIKITPIMVKQIAEIDKFNGSWNAGNVIENSQIQSLKRISTIESIGSSNRIEGNKLSDIEVETILSNINQKSFKTRDEEEIIGYSSLINMIYDNYDMIPLTENYIKQLHRIMLGNVSKDIHHCGEYKKVSNQVVAFDSKGSEIGVIFETAKPFDTPYLMNELVQWTNQNLNEKFLHPFLTIGVFIVHFLAIHPFQDGNGRLSRALTALLLLKNGYTYVPYSSIESIIEASKESYYLALRNTQRTVWSKKVNYEPWIGYFLTVLEKQKMHLGEKIDSIQKQKSLGQNAQAVLDLFNRKEDWTSIEIAIAVDMNIETVRKILQKLSKEKYIEKRGSTKSSYYRRIV